MDRNKNQFRPQPEWRLDGCSFQAPGLEGAGGVHAPLQHQMGGLSLKPEVASRNRQRRSLAERNQARQLGIAKQPGWRGGKNTCVQTERAMSPSTKASGGPRIVDRAIFQSQLDELRVREKAHTREGDAIAAVRRRLPMVEVDANIRVTGEAGRVPLLEVFEGRRQLYVYYFMWHDEKAAPEQCEGCTFFNGQIQELSYLHSRD